MFLEAKDQHWREIQKHEHFSRPLVKPSSNRSKFTKSISQQETLSEKLSDDDHAQSDENVEKKVVIIRQDANRASSIEKYLDMNCGLKQISKVEMMRY